MVTKIAQKIREEFQFDDNAESMVHAEGRLLLVTKARWVLIGLLIVYGIIIAVSYSGYMSFARFLAMTGMHIRDLEHRFPESRKKIYLLREFEENHDPKDPDIFDPIGLPLHAYEKCFELMKQPIEKVADIL